MKEQVGRQSATISQAVMQAMAVCAFTTCVLMGLGALIKGAGLEDKVAVASLVCGIALCALALGLPALAERVTDAERSHPLACGIALGALLLASYAGLYLVGVPFPLKAMAAGVQGAVFWLGFSACVFLADVLEIKRPVAALACAAALAAVLAYALVVMTDGVVAYVFVAVLGSAALTAELAEAAGISPNSEDKPLVNIFKYFNPRAPIANFISGAIFGISFLFLVGYRAVGLDCAAFAAAGAVAGGLIPCKGNDAVVNRAYVVFLAVAIVCIVLLPLEGKRIASAAVVGLNAFYFVRNVGWAFGQCLKLGGLDTAILSRALMPFLVGVGCGCVAGVPLTAAGSEVVMRYVGAAMLLALVVDAVYFLPFLASPFARESGADGADTGEHREHADLAKAILSEEGEGAGADAGQTVAAADPDADLRAKCAVVAEEDGLTEREGDILLLLCKGRTASYIGDELFISKNTAKVHISHIYNKTGIHSQQELMSYVESIEVG